MKPVKDAFFKQKRTVRFYKYMFSYIIFVVILLTVSASIVNNKFLSTLQNEIEASNVTALKQVRYNMDIRIKEMEQAAVRISDNPMLTQYELATGGEIAAYYAIRELNDYRAGNTLFYDIALYHNYGDNGRIYASSGTYSLEMFFNKIYRYENTNKDEFIRMIESIKYPVLRPVETVNMGSFNNMRLATYIYPLLASSAKPYGAVLYLIDEGKLQGMVKDLLKDYNGFIFILDERNQPIVSLPSGDIADNAQNILEKMNIGRISNTISEIDLYNVSYSVVKLTSDYNKWNYITVMPTAQFMKKVHSIRQVLYITALAVLSLGIIMSFFFANSSYKPLRKMAEVLKGQIQEGNTGEYKDEIDYLSNSIQELTVKNQGLISKLKSKSGLMKEQLLQSLINGKPININDIDNLVELSNLKFVEPIYMVLLFLIDDYDSFRKHNSGPMQEILNYSIVNVLEELSAEFGAGYAVDLGSERGITLVLNIKREYNKDEIYNEFASKAKEFFKENFQIVMTVGVGTAYDDSSKLCISFMEAQNAAYYRLIKGKGQIIFHKDLQNNSGAYKHSVELDIQLVMYIKQGNASEAVKVIKSIFDNVRKQNAPPEAVQYSYFVLVNTLTKILDEIEVKEVKVFSGTNASFLTAKFETLEAMENQVSELCQSICNHIEKQKKSKNTNLCNRIITYVNENYTDNNLGVDGLADIFGLSPSYITRFIKDQTGFSLKQYMDMKRMSKVRELLKSTNRTLKEIIEDVGYLDETNFIRKFKKLESMTPIQYRNLTSSSKSGFGIKNDK